MKIIITLILVALTAFSSCKKDSITGHGPVVSEIRPLSDFSRVEVHGKTNVTINYGTTFKVEVKAYSNLLTAMKTRVNNGLLTIGYESGTIIHNDNSEVFITLPLLTFFSTTGNSNIYLNSGTSGNFHALLTGSGKIDALGFSVKNADVTITGNGTVSISVTDSLNAKIHGTGTIYYRGNPAVSSIITGNGKVEKL